VFRIEGAGSGITYVSNHGHVYREVPSGIINGTNKVFRISSLPIANTEVVYLNGMAMDSPGDYSMTGDGQDITFVTAPIAGDKILVNYDLEL
jgi:hypothetical protein